MRIERHVFGSYKGYTTLARSPGISAEDARDLEGGVYGFGQTEDPRYAKSLQSRAAYFTRVLSGNRRGLTRVFAGAPDSDGRPTNLMMTAVLACTDWDGQLRGAVSHVLADKQIWQWAAGSDITALERTYLAPVSTIPRKSVLKITALVSEIERRWNTSTPIIVGEAEFGGEEIRAVEILIPPKNRPQFTSACRSLGPQLAVTLNQLAAEASLQKVNFHFDPRFPASPFAEFLLENGMSDGELPIAELMTYRTFAISERSTPARRRMYVPPPMPAQEHERRWMIWLGAAVLISLVIAGAYFIQRANSARHMAANPLPPLPASIPVTKIDAPTAGEIDTARSAMNTPVPAVSTSAPPTTPSAKSPTIVHAPPLAVLTPAESKQDLDLDRLQAHWDEFMIHMNGKSLTFAGTQGEELYDLEQEMRTHGLVKRIEMGASGNITALPLLLVMRDEYFEVNSLLSDPDTKYPAELAKQTNQLAAYVMQAKLILNPIGNRRSAHAKMFSNIDRTIQIARQRLKNAKNGGGL